MSTQPVLNQIALSCIDLVQTEQWFREGLGFVPAGGARLPTGTPFADDMLSAPKAEAICWWMLAANPGIRIALLQFSVPLPRLKPADFRPCDIGYTRIGVHVPDFETALGALARLGSPPVGPVLGAPGERRACIRNPDGVFVEIMERDPLPDAPRADREGPVAMRSLTLSTPDLAASLAYFSALTGGAPADISLHTEAHEALWGLPGAKCRRATLRSGDVLLELVEYADPAGTAWPEDYRLSDQGILNISFGMPAAAQHEEALKRCRALGAKVGTPAERTAYVKDSLGFSTELALVGEDASGFRPAPIDGRPMPAEYTSRSTVTIDAPLDRVWAALNDHERMHRWFGADEFRVLKHGTPHSAGYGALRLLITLGRQVEQQVVRVIPGHIGYRAIAGTPFSYHNGTVDARETGSGTQVDWTIRFRTESQPLGEVVHGQLQKGIGHQLNDLKAMVEGEEISRDNGPHWRGWRGRPRRKIPTRYR